MAFSTMQQLLCRSTFCAALAASVSSALGVQLSRADEYYAGDPSAGYTPEDATSETKPTALPNEEMSATGNPGDSCDQLACDD